MRTLPDKVSLMGSNEARAFDNLPADEEDWRKNLHRICLEEHGGVEWLDAPVAAKDEDENLDKNGNVGAIWLESTIVGQLGAVQALGFAGSVVENKGDGHGHKVNNTATGDESCEPANNLGRAAAGREQREEGKEHDNHEAVDGDTAAVALAEEARSAAVESQTVERSGGTVGVGVTGREDGSHQQSIDNVREDTDIESVHGHDVGRGGSTLALCAVDVDSNKVRVVVGENNANTESTAKEEETKSPVDSLESSLDVDSGTLGLGGHHGNVLGSDDGESGTP